MKIVKSVKCKTIQIKSNILVSLATQNILLFLHALY